MNVNFGLTANLFETEAARLAPVCVRVSVCVLEREREVTNERQQTTKS